MNKKKITSALGISSALVMGYVGMNEIIYAEEQNPEMMEAGSDAAYIADTTPVIDESSQEVLHVSSDDVPKDLEGNDYVHPVDVDGNEVEGVWKGGKATSSGSKAVPEDNDPNTFDSPLGNGTAIVDTHGFVLKDRSNFEIFDTENFVWAATKGQAGAQEDGDIVNLMRKSVSTEANPIMETSYINSIIYIGGLDAGVTKTIKTTGDTPLFRIKFSDVALLSDGSKADFVMDVWEVEIIRAQSVEKGTPGPFNVGMGTRGSFEVRSTNYLGTINDKGEWIYTLNEKNTRYRTDDKVGSAYLVNTGLRMSSGNKMTYTFYLTDKDGNRVENETLLFSVTDLDTGDFVTGVGDFNTLLDDGTITYGPSGSTSLKNVWTPVLGDAYQQDPEAREYRESMEIISGAVSQAYVPADNFLQYEQSSDADGLTANGIRFVSNYLDGATLDSGFAVLLDSAGSTFRWTGGTNGDMGTVLFDFGIDVSFGVNNKEGGSVKIQVTNLEGETNTFTVSPTGLMPKNAVTVFMEPESTHILKTVTIDNGADKKIVDVTSLTYTNGQSSVTLSDGTEVIVNKLENGIYSFTVDAMLRSMSFVATFETQKATVTYVDQDNEQLEQDILQGPSSTSINTMNSDGSRSDTPYSTQETIQSYVNMGYELVSDGYTSRTKTFDNDASVDQEFIVQLRAVIETITVNNPKSTSDVMNPNGDTYPAGLRKEDLQKTITRTIHYRYNTEDGDEVSQDVVQSVIYTRSAKVNHVTGEVTYGDWTTDKSSFDSVVSPVVSGWEADTIVVEEEKDILDTAANSEVYVLYAPVNVTTEEKTVTRTIHYRYDSEEGQQASDSIVQSVIFTRTISENTKTGVITYSEWSSENDTFGEVASPSIYGWMAKQAVIPAQRAGVNDTDSEVIVIYDPVRETTEERTITRTIHYIDGVSGNVLFDTTIQNVTFTRTVIENLNTGEITYTEWTSENPFFSAVDSPVLEGMSASVNQVLEEAVTIDSSDRVVVVVYNAIIKEEPVQVIETEAKEEIEENEETTSTVSQGVQTSMSGGFIGYVSIMATSLLGMFKASKEE